MKKKRFHLFLLLAVILLAFLPSCSHNYDPDTLDLGFYQWNLWYDTSAEADLQGPSCGWEEINRGMGKLVRIPALAAQHFPEQEERGVLWYHCRFTLPENWEERKINLQIDGVAPVAELFLNQEQIAELNGNEPSYLLDVSDRIYYTRDNHLALRIRMPGDADWDRAGISGVIWVKSVQAGDSLTDSDGPYDEQEITE